MKLLIATMLQIIEWEDGKSRIIASGDLAKGNAHYHGIATDGEQWYVTGAKDFQYGIWIFDRDLQPLGFTEGPLYEPHGSCWHNNRLYVTNTGKNRIEIWDREHWSNITFNPSSCDVDHLNDITFHDGRFYVTEFRHRHQEGPSAIRVCDEDMGLLRTAMVGDPIHNAVIIGDSLYTLVSRAPAGFYKIHLKRWQVSRVALFKDKAFLRGLVNEGGTWFVGASRWEDDRGKRPLGNAEVHILDNMYKPLDKLIFRDAGPLCAIHVVEGVD